MLRLALILVAMPAIPVHAAELELRFTALERILAEQVFTQDGRHYVRGSKATRCQFAYLEKPHISGEMGADGGRLRVGARFSGRSAIDVLGGCVGLGDSFDLVMTASPVVRAGAIALDDVKITTARESYYIRRVRAALAGSISKDLKIEVREQARKLLEQPGGSYQPDLAAFDLTGIRIKPDALVLVIEFRLVIK
jgi:hypothetical protein